MIKRILVLIRTNQFLTLIIILFSGIAMMTIISLSMRTDPETTSNNTNLELPEIDSNTLTIPDNIPEGVLRIEGEYNEQGIDDSPKKQIESFDSQIPYSEKYFSIIKNGSGKYVVQYDGDFQYSLQAVSMYLRQFNLNIYDDEIVLEEI